MREPADLLVLDEPTNDLDIPTLEVLEDSLAEFDGGLILVTHDRFMLERVSTVILALDGRGGTSTFADYSQWEAAREAVASAPRKPSERAPERERSRSKRLPYHEQREWDGMEQAILDAEGALEAAQRGRRSGDRLRSRRAPGALRRAGSRPRRSIGLRALGGARGRSRPERPRDRLPISARARFGRGVDCSQAVELRKDRAYPFRHGVEYDTNALCDPVCSSIRVFTCRVSPLFSRSSSLIIFGSAGTVNA
jgi:hypothetical protein